MAADIYGGSRHTHILTADGEVLSCGAGEFGRLGTGATTDTYSPTPVDTLVNETIIEVTTGYNHSLVLTEGGRVYGWGGNDTGQLGNIYAMLFYALKIVLPSHGSISHIN